MTRSQNPTRAESQADTDPDSDPAWVKATLAPLVAASYWFDPGDRGEPFTVRIRFSGHRLGVDGKPGAADRFEIVETVRDVLPGSGPVAVTARVGGVNEGEWTVTAEPLLERRHRGSRSGGQVRPADTQKDLPVTPSFFRALRWWGTPRMSASVPGTVKRSAAFWTRQPSVSSSAWRLEDQAAF